MPSSPPIFGRGGEKPPPIPNGRGGERPPPPLPLSAGGVGTTFFGKICGKLIKAKGEKNYLKFCQNDQEGLKHGEKFFL